jgi:class 3 adenylate cyclase
MQSGASMFGTDASEYIPDPVVIANYAQAEFDELGAWPLGPAEIDAWVTSPIGLAVVRSHVLHDTRDPAPLRVTIVYQLEADEWRVFHQHWSVGVPNVDVFDVTLDEILNALREERPDLSGSAAADGTVTILFTDIEDSTSLNSTFGDHAWMDVLRAHNAVMTKRAAEHGGTVVKGIGDGFMLAFASARRALHFAAAVERDIADTFDDPGSPIRVRIGVHVGEVVREADDLFGHAVNYAARVAGAAVGGEVVVSSLVHGLVAPTGEFAFSACSPRELKGFQGSHQLYRLELAAT